MYNVYVQLVSYMFNVCCNYFMQIKILLFTYYLLSILCISYFKYYFTILFVKCIYVIFLNIKFCVHNQPYLLLYLLQSPVKVRKSIIASLYSLYSTFDCFPSLNIFKLYSLLLPFIAIFSHHSILFPSS